MDLLLSRMKRMGSEQSRDRGLALACRPSDVFITTYPKCGTTWVTFICHCLRTRGDESFGEITEVVPWTIFAEDCGQDLDAEQAADPRLFKSHESYDKVAKGGKYIYVARDPRTAGPSFYHFLLDYMHGDKSTVSIEQFFETIFTGAGSNSGRIWDHFLSFYEQRSNPNVLWLFYEDLLDDTGLETAVRCIAEFIDVELDIELLRIVKQKCSFSYMKRLECKFDDHFVFDHVKGMLGLPADAQCRSTKVSKGDNRHELSAELQASLDRAWLQVFRDTPLRSYSELRTALSISKRVPSPELV